MWSASEMPTTPAIYIGMAAAVMTMAMMIKRSLRMIRDINVVAPTREFKNHLPILIQNKNHYM